MDPGSFECGNQEIPTEYIALSSHFPESRFKYTILGRIEKKLLSKCRNEPVWAVIEVKRRIVSQLRPLTKVMTDTTKRSILRWIHLIFGIPILGYVYSPFEQLPNYAPTVRYVAIPVIVFSGLWMWKGHLLRRLIRKDWPDVTQQ